MVWTAWPNAAKANSAIQESESVRKMQDTETDADVGSTVEHAAHTLALTIVHHPQTSMIGLRRLLEPRFDLTIGRASTILPGVFDSKRLSREHARFGGNAQALWVEDLESRNGTRVGGSAIVKRTPLARGEVVRLGDVFVAIDQVPLKKPRKIEGFHGVSPQAESVRNSVETVARTDISVVIIGETGVGKGVVARAIHDASRATGEFVGLNCAAVDEHLLSSDLFGHKKGAFTGADRTRRGLIQEAAGGSLFLDELPDAPVRFQASLLKVLDSGQYRSLGSDVANVARVRWLAAAQPRIGQAVSDGTFREDLWARIARWTIPIAPLRERRQDVPCIAQALVARIAGPDVGIAPTLVERMVSYDWPLNVRELETFVTQACMMQKGQSVLQLDDGLSARLVSSSQARGSDAKAPNPTGLEPTLRRVTPRPSSEVLSEALSRHQGSVRAVAAEFVVDRKTVYRWCKALGLDPADWRTS